MTRKEYGVIKYHQVLFSGTWKDGDWDWDFECKWFNNLKDAEAYFNKQIVDDDTPIIRLEELNYGRYEDGVEFIEETKILKELS